MHGLGPHGVPFLEAQRPVVEAGGQPEAVFGQRRLAAEVALVHAADLRDRDVALVGEDQRVVGQVFEQRRRRLAGLAAREIARIVLDALAHARGLQHLEVEIGALFEPLRLEEPPLSIELVEPALQLVLDGLDALDQRRPRRHVVRIGVDLGELQVVGLLAGERVELLDALDLVAEEAEAPAAVLVMGREQLHRVAAHAEIAAAEIRRALVLQSHEIGDELALVDALADRDAERHGRIGLDRADAVDARHGGHDDDVVALQQRPGGGVAHPVDLLVDGRFLLDVRVGPRHIGLGLIVIVVGNEVFDGIVGEEALELAVELRRQRLVGRENQGRPVGGGDHLGHGEGLAGAGDAEQHLVALLALHAVDEFGDGRGLVALGLVFGTQLERDAAFRLVGPGRAMRHPGLGLEARIAGLQELLEHFGRGRGAAEATRMFGGRRFGLPAFAGWRRHEGPGRMGSAESNGACGASANPSALRRAERSGTAALRRPSFKAGFSSAARCSSSGTTSGRPAFPTLGRFGEAARARLQPCRVRASGRASERVRRRSSGLSASRQYGVRRAMREAWTPFSRTREKVARRSWVG